MIGKFIISLDLELFWGVLDHAQLDGYGKNVLAVHSLFPQLLELFKEYDIHVTVAYVGMMGMHDKKELLKNIPSVKPRYLKKQFSPYRDNFDYISDDRYFFAPQLIDELKKYPNIEIASHTFSHYYCMEEGQNTESFEADLCYAVKQAEENDIRFASIVFPRNQVTNEYLPILNKYGIFAYRGNPSKFFEQKGGMCQRILRFLDTYVNVTGYNTYTFKYKNDSCPINIPASRFLRPYSRKMAFLDFLKLERIKQSMTYAARNGEMYHLWWHPHNFGNAPERNMVFLMKIFNHYKYLKSKYTFQSMTMHELALQIRDEK